MPSIYRLLRYLERYTKTDMVYLANAGTWTNLHFVITSILALLLSVAYANFLSPETFGLYQFFLSLAAVVTALTLAGMNSAVAQAVARGYEGVLRDSVRAQIRWAIVPFLAGMLGSVYYVIQGNLVIATGLALVAVLAPLTSVFNTYAAYLSGKREFKRGFLYALVIAAAYYASIFAAVYYLEDAVLLIVVNLGINALATAFVYWRTLRRYQPGDTKDPEAITYGKHLSVMNAFGTIITQLDSILVFHFLGAAGLALYTFSIGIPDRVGSLSKFISVAALPKFSNQSLAEIRRHILGKLVKAALAGLVLAVAFALAAPLIFKLLFPAYLAAVPYAQLFALNITMAAVLNLSVTALIAQRLKRELYIYNLGNPVVLLALQVPLLIWFGIWGILVAKLISNAFNIVFSTALIFHGHQKDESLLERPG
jgi:O-antigen/teichoic acid export membrane protein